MQTPRQIKSNWKAIFEVFRLFFKLGIISYGGPAAHIALMEQEVVRKRGWLDHEHFLDLLATTNLIPGPNATEMAVHIGYVRAGYPGLIAAGIAFIFPAFAITLLLSWVYVQYSALPEATSLFYGVHPVILSVILVATYRLGKAALKGMTQIALGIVTLAAAMLGVNEVILLLAAGLAGILFYARPAWMNRKPPLVMFLPWLPAIASILKGTGWLEDRLVQLFLFFLKVGALIFGSGMVLFAFIQQDIVERLGWLSQQQLIDAIAIGQMTPGPVLSSATFIGYLVSGWEGAVVATIAVFLPSFIIIVLIGPLIYRVRRSPTAQAFLRGVNAAVVALILVVSLALFQSAIVDGWTFLLMIAGIVALLRFRIDSFWLVLAGAVAGFIRFVLI